VSDLDATFAKLERDAATAVPGQVYKIERRAAIKYRGTDTALEVDWSSRAAMAAEFTKAYLRRFAFSSPDHPLVVESIALELVLENEPVNAGFAERPKGPVVPPPQSLECYMDGALRETRLVDRDRFHEGQSFAGPAIVFDRNATSVIEPGWQGRV